MKEMTEGINLVIRKDFENHIPICDVKAIIQGDVNNHGESHNSMLIAPDIPANLHMSVAPVRMQTFQRAGKIAISVDKLVNSGFYFVGPNDSVKCYACNGTFYGWLKDENEWERHAGFYPECLHVNHVKDRKFIEEMIDKVSGYKDLKNRPSKTRTKAKLFICRNCTGPADILYTKCGHISACRNCHEQLTVCPQCSERTDNKLRVYM
jgi:hypothetical protein